MTIGDLTEKFGTFELSLVTDSTDVDEILSMFGFGKKIKERYQGLFVRENNGEYDRIYAFEGIIPYLYKEVKRLRLR